MRSENIPSRDSLLPPSRDTIEDYDDETDFESDSESQSTISRLSPTQLPIQPLTTITKAQPHLWVSGLTSALLTTTHGLPQPDSQIWQAHVNEQVDIIRFKSRVSSSLPVLSSSDLWTSMKSTSLMEDVTTMRGADTVANGASVARLSAVAKDSANLWTPQQQKDGRTPVGRLSLDTSRSNIYSKCLWKPRRSSKVTIAWTTRSTIPTTISMMWAPKDTLEHVAIAGPSIKSKQWSGYQTTTSAPEAIIMIRKPRSNQKPLSQLESSQLWNGNNNLQADHHWISESSTRPKSPSVYSETSSGGSSPVSDVASIQSNSTKASSLWGSIKSVGTSAWWDSKIKKKHTPSSPNEKVALNDANFNAAPLIDASIVSHDISVRHPVFFTKSLLSTADDIHPSALGYAIQHEAQAEQASKPSLLWNNPEVAISAQASSGSMWSKGLVHKSVEPSYFSHSLQQRSRKTSWRSLELPTLQSTTFWQPIPLVEPARDWLSLKTPAHAQTWIPQKVEVDEERGLWIPSKQATLPTLPDIFAHLPREYRIKKAASFRPHLLPKLDSNELFKTRLAAKSATHWLSATSSTRRNGGPRTWVAASNASSQVRKESTGMWDPQSAPAISPPGLFSTQHIEPCARRRRDSAPATEISSTEMWRLDAAMPRSPVDWLVKRRASRVDFRY